MHTHVYRHRQAQTHTYKWARAINLYGHAHISLDFMKIYTTKKQANTDYYDAEFKKTNKG